MREELTKLLEDIKKVKQASELLSSVSTTKMGVEVGNLVDYALTHNIIKGTDDIVTLSIENPELKDIFTKSYDNYISSKIKKESDYRRKAEEKYEYRYAGTYNSLSEVPGYGTEWNERCTPAGVVIRGVNTRC